MIFFKVYQIYSKWNMRNNLDKASEYEAWDSVSAGGWLVVH